MIPLFWRDFNLRGFSNECFDLFVPELKPPITPVLPQAKRGFGVGFDIYCRKIR